MARAAGRRLVLVGSVYHYRRVVPVELRGAFGRGEVWRSLHTSDRRRAEKRRDRMDRAVESIWSRLRAQIAHGAAGAANDPEPPCYLPTYVHGDFFALAATIPNASVDLVLTDPPYGHGDAAYKRTGHEWDNDLDLERMWRELQRVATPEAVFVFFGVQPMVTDLINSNRAEFGWTDVWVKSRKTRVLTTAYRPLREHEDIVVFVRQGYHYLPPHKKRRGVEPKRLLRSGTANFGALYRKTFQPHLIEQHIEHVTSVHRVPNDPDPIHPTQKPVALLRKLVETFSAPGALVLDPFAGSGSLAIAALQAGRRSLSYEADAGYAAKAQARIAEFMAESERLAALPYEITVGRDSKRRVRQ
jgi:site-specific DNA-methyltransferase (adenine-specific)